MPSPEPAEILELDTIRLLSSCGVTVICAGGGGIPVVPGCGDHYRGIEAVVDKDLIAALLAEAVGADALLLLTDVEAVLEGYETAHPRPLRHVTPGELRIQFLPSRLDGPEGRGRLPVRGVDRRVRSHRAAGRRRRTAGRRGRHDRARHLVCARMTEVPGMQDMQP